MNDRLNAVSGPAALRIDRTHKPQAPRRGMAAVVWAAGLAVVVLVGAGWWSMRPIPVRTAAIVSSLPAQQLVQLSASGRVVAQVRAAVASKASGRLVELLVSEGSVVKQGALIARIDAADAEAALASVRASLQQARAQLRQAQVELSRARDDLKRTNELQAVGFLSPQAREQARGRAEAAEAAAEAATAAVRVAEAQVQVQAVSRDQTEIRAPFDGMVVSKLAQVGDVVSPLSVAAGAQGAVVTMADLSTLKVEADVSEAQIGRVNVGGAVDVSFDALPGEHFSGAVAAILPVVDRARATVTVRLRLDKLDPRILPEMSAKVSFLSRPTTEADRRPILLVPKAAVVRQDERLVVFRVREELAEARVQAVPVQLGNPVGESIQLVAGAGLQAGDRLVLEPSGWLRDGGMVRPGGP